MPQKEITYFTKDAKQMKKKKKIKKSKDFPPTKEVGGSFHLTQLSSLNFPFTYTSQYWQVTEVYGDQYFSTKITLTKAKIFGQEDESCA